MLQNIDTQIQNKWTTTSSNNNSVVDSLKKKNRNLPKSDQLNKMVDTLALNDKRTISKTDFNTSNIRQEIKSTLTSTNNNNNNNNKNMNININTKINPSSTLKNNINIIPTTSTSTMNKNLNRNTNSRTTNSILSDSKTSTATISTSLNETELNNQQTQQLHLLQIQQQAAASSTNPTTLDQEKQQLQSNQQQQQIQMSYHDVICSHLYQCFTHSLYSDLKLRFQGGEEISHEITFFLHKILCIRSPFLAQLIDKNERVNQMNLRYQILDISVPVTDINITTEGLSIALGHLYSSYSHHHLLNTDNTNSADHSKLLRSVLASAYYLRLPDLCSITTNLIHSDINYNTVLDYCRFVNQPNFLTNYEEFSQSINDWVFTALCKNVINELTEINRQNIWEDHEGKGYKQLVELFSELPFEWLKKIVENKDFVVPNDIERYYFAREVVSLRSHKQSTTGSSVVIGEENVVLAFGMVKNSSITIVRKLQKHQTGSQERRVWKVHG